MFHTDLTKRVRRPKGLKAISRRALAIARAYLRDVYTRRSRQARAKRRAICEICEICVRQKNLCERELQSLLTEE